MVVYANHHEAIIDLHERGFNQDFELTDDGIRWIQQQVVLPISDCMVIEYYNLQSGGVEQEDIIILAILSLSQSIKGILIHHLLLSPCCWPGKFHNMKATPCSINSRGKIRQS